MRAKLFTALMQNYNTTRAFIKLFQKIYHDEIDGSKKIYFPLRERMTQDSCQSQISEPHSEEKDREPA